MIHAEGLVRNQIVFFAIIAGWHIRVGLNHPLP
jgi:hypothetical protein